MNEEKFFFKVLGQSTALGLGLIGYRGVLKSFTASTSFWMPDVFSLVVGAALFLFFEIG